MRILITAYVYLIIAAAAIPAASLSQDSPPREKPAAIRTLPGSALGDSSRVIASVSDIRAIDRPFRTNTERPLSMYLARNTRLLFGYDVYRVSTFQCALEGVGVGMTVGMCAAALGMTAGAWDEQTSWYITGAMAAIGAIFGGAVKANDPGWSLRVRWDPER